MAKTTKSSKKASSKTPKEKSSALDAVLSDLRSKGLMGLYVGAEIQDNFEARIPFDIFGINIITRGGAPFNAITEIKGPPSSFKTTITLGLCKQAQKMFGPKCNIVWVSTENGIDVPWARHLGVKIPYSEKEIAEFKALGLSDSDLKSIVDEQADSGRFIMLANEKVEDDLDAAQKMLETGEVSVYVLDSVGAIMAEGEDEKDHDDYQVAINTRLVGKHVRKLHSMGNRLTNIGAQTALILINQVRVKIGGFSPNPRITPMDNPAGFGLKHGKVLALETKIVGFEKDGNGKVWGKHVVATCDKSKVCVPHRSCQVAFIVRGDNPRNLPVGPDAAVETTELAKDCGFIRYDRSSKTWKYGEGTLTYGGDPVNKDNLALALGEDEDLLRMVQDDVAVYHRSLEIGGHAHYTPDDAG
jgi:RecA/RadA recombinase